MFAVRWRRKRRTTVIMRREEGGEVVDSKLTLLKDCSESANCRLRLLIDSCPHFHLHSIAVHPIRSAKASPIRRLSASLPPEWKEHTYGQTFFGIWSPLTASLHSISIPWKLVINCRTSLRSLLSGRPMARIFWNWCGRTSANGLL